MAGYILIVDDEKGQREILNTILQKEGYRAVDVPGAREALERLAKEDFDLILTDLKMQGMSGMELLEKVLAEDARQCVVMMTAHGTIDSAEEAMKKGAFDYLEKPLERRPASSLWTRTRGPGDRCGKPRWYCPRPVLPGSAMPRRAGQWP